MPANIKLANKFHLKEFFVSDDHKDIAEALYLSCNNFQIHLAFNLAQDAQRMRDHIQKEDDKTQLIITSAYRDQELNELTDGAAERSLHKQFLAFDCKTLDPHDLYRIYTYITEWSNLSYSECFIYRTEAGIYTNIHYAKQTAGYTEKRHNIMVRLDKGGLMPLEDYENGRDTT